MANATVIGATFVVFRLVAEQPTVVIVGAFLVFAVGIIYYGHFLASQVCGECGKSIFFRRRECLTSRTLALIAPLHIPGKCPHCGKVTRW